MTELVISALTEGGKLLWYVGPTYRQSKMIAWRMLKNINPDKQAKYNEAELSVTFFNGSVLELKGADNEDSLRGTGLHGLVVDEFATIYNNWQVWNEVLRPALTDKKGWALFIGTPKGKNALWELWLKGQKKEDGFISWQFNTCDNPFIDKYEVEVARKEMPERYFKQEYEASFEDYVGLIYPEFSKNHVIEPTYLSVQYPRIGAIDPALSGTTGVLKAAIDEAGHLIIYDEYYEQNKRVSDVVSTIKEDIKWYIDPASAAKSIQKEGKLYSLFDEYRDNGLSPRTAENDVEGGINRVGEWFKQGKIRIFNTCKNLIYELERYHWAEERETVAGVTKAKPYKKADHLCLDEFSRITMADNTEKPIKHIKIGDIVQTSEGTQKVLDVALTGKNVEVWRLKLTDGKELYATGNHPIYTSEGKKRLDSLRYGDTIEVWNPYTLTAENIIGTVNTTQRVEEKSVSTLMCGSIIMGQFLMAILSTIKMVTLPIMLSSIWGFRNEKVAIATPQIILKSDYKTQFIVNEIKNIWQKFALLLKNGIVRKKVGCGIVGIVKGMFGQIENQSNDFVCIARNSFGLKTEQENTVLVGVKPPSVETVSKTNLKSSVYNLTVANSHNYYANGILVSNCDCLRYLIMSRYEAADPQVPEFVHPNSPWAHMQREKAMKERKSSYNPVNRRV